MKLQLAAAYLLFVSSSTPSALAFSAPPKRQIMKVRAPLSTSQLHYSVGIVGATGAVGKEIRSCLEDRNFPATQLRIFGSERSAGKTVSSKAYGDITIEPFGVEAARECDVVFLAVSGDFALEHARAMAEGDDGCVVIDNSVCVVCVCCCTLLLSI